MASSFRVIFVVCALLTIHVLGAFDLSQRHDPQGPLKVRLDYALATLSTSNKEASHQWLFSTHLTFAESVESITAGQLKAILEDARAELRAEMLQYGMSTRRVGDERVPKLESGAMGLLAVGNELYISTTQKGGDAFINHVYDSPVRHKLEMCMAFWNSKTEKDEDHVNQRRCVELQVAHQYYLKHPQDLLENLKPMARMATASKKSQIIPPCGVGPGEETNVNDVSSKPVAAFSDIVHLD